MLGLLSAHSLASLRARPTVAVLGLEQAVKHVRAKLTGPLTTTATHAMRDTHCPAHHARLDAWTWVIALPGGGIPKSCGTAGGISLVSSKW